MSSMQDLEENEDFDNVPLVRMIDVQPSRNRNVNSKTESEFENSSDDSNIESDDSNKQQEDSDSCDKHFDAIDEIPIEILKQEIKAEPKNTQEFWPTLEILPGGVIKNSDKTDICETLKFPDLLVKKEPGDVGIYACAKCPESFKDLCSLVKHMKFHRDEKNRRLGKDLGRLNAFEKEMIVIRRARLEMEKSYMKQKSEVMIRISSALEKIGSNGLKNVL